MGGTGVIDRFLDTFTRYIDSGFGLLGSEVGFLATTLVAIDVTRPDGPFAVPSDQDRLTSLGAPQNTLDAMSERPEIAEFVKPMRLDLV